MQDMANTTPRRSTRIPHTHTPKMTERKKGLFQVDGMAPIESLSQHRRLPVVDSESDSDDCDLGIISTLDSSSGDEAQEQSALKTPEKGVRRETRSHTQKLLKENNELKNFLKSPFTLNKFQTRKSYPDKCSLSTPVTPHLQYHPATPSSSHSCTSVHSVHTTSSTSSRARKSLASLIADTESCSSSLKDLNFDSDSGADSKENTPTRKSRRLKMTPKFSSFKGILVDHKKNSTSSPVRQPFVSLTKMDITNFISPTQMLKTPHSTSEVSSPPKLGHSKRHELEVAESPESEDLIESEKSHKRLRDESFSESAPNSKYLKLDTSGSAPKARLSLFNSDKLKEILSTKSFYGKKSPELNTSFTNKISNAIVSTNNQKRTGSSHSHRRKTRKSGQINMGVRHRIRKPKLHKGRIINLNKSLGTQKSANSTLNSSVLSSTSLNNTINSCKNLSQEIDLDKTDPFDKEKQTIDNLLSQWTEEEIPASELTYSSKPQTELCCFNSTVIEETNQIFQPVTITPVQAADAITPNSVDIMELGPKVSDVVMSELEEQGHKADHGSAPKGQFLPVEGGYIFVGGTVEQDQEELPDLDEIERELRMLDEQILKMAHSNNINPQAVLASTESNETAQTAGAEPSNVAESAESKSSKLFPIFEKPNSGAVTSSNAKGTPDSKKPLLKNSSNQYVIDAGQKRFGATQCNECGVIYQIGDPQDEHDHLVHHNAVDVLRFNGWKDERVVGAWDGGRCICVRGAEPAWRRVVALLDRIVHPQLGYGAALPTDKAYTYSAYLYIEKKQIIGCLVVEPKVKAYKLIPGDPDCCSVEHYPVKCGVSRMWTHVNHRRRGIAARLLDCARVSFLYGAALAPGELAFSAPTQAGKSLATHYCGTSDFLVYLD